MRISALAILAQPHGFSEEALQYPAIRR